MRILVTGGTGLVGRRIVARLRERGDEVLILSRRARDDSSIVGDPAVAGPWLDEVAQSDVVIHLAGEPVAGRWTKKRRARIRDSRVNSTRLVAEAIAKSPTRPDGSPRVLICASAIGYYGMYEDNPTEFVEDDPPDSGFLSDVCIAWENAAEPARAAGVRVASIRIGMVLSSDGGALPPLARLFRWFLGGPVATGQQWISWIHIDDLVDLFLLVLDRPDAQGPINGTAPEPITNWGFSKTLASVLHRPCWLPAPKIPLRLLMGEASQLVTHGQRVIPTRAKALDYEYKFPLLEPALRDLLSSL